MCPRKLIITKQRVLDAAIELVRAEGLGALKARAVAKKLGASVIPIYRAYPSMDALIQDVLKAALDLLLEYTSRHYTDLPFRNSGVALVMFACDEPQLYRALFIERHSNADVAGQMLASLRKTVDLTPEFRQFSRAMRDELIMDMWIYTHGLASMILSGMLPTPEPGLVDQKLNRVGAIVIGAAITTTLQPVSMFERAPRKRPKPLAAKSRREKT